MRTPSVKALIKTFRISSEDAALIKRIGDAVDERGTWESRDDEAENYRRRHAPEGGDSLLEQIIPRCPACERTEDVYVRGDARFPCACIGCGVVGSYEEFGVPDPGRDLKRQSGAFRPIGWEPSKSGRFSGRR